MVEKMGLHKEWMKEIDNIKTIDDLNTFINKLLNDYEHDYGTIVHAVFCIMMASFKYANDGKQGGITGFQASCLMWMFIDKFGHCSGPKRLFPFYNLLFPQYDYNFNKIDGEIYLEIKKEAERILTGQCSDRVRKRCTDIINGKLPLGFEILNECE